MYTRLGMDLKVAVLGVLLVATAALLCALEYSQALLGMGAFLAIVGSSTLVWAFYFADSTGPTDGP